jgi:serine transporter
MASSGELACASAEQLGKIPFTRYDAGWVVLCIGMAIGAGVVFLPVQVGVSGFWVFVCSVALAYPALYFMQELYLRTLSESKECQNYSNIITQYLGKNWGVYLSIAYFLMLLKGMLSYSMAVVFDSAKYLQTYGVTTGLLSSNMLYGLAIISFLVVIAAQGEKLLFKVAGPLVMVKLAIVVLLGLVMVPYWHIANAIDALPDNFWEFVQGTMLTLPMTLFSILFVQILNPMNIAYRKIEKDPRVATYRAIRANRVAYTILLVSVLFFATSFAFTLSHEQAMQAKAQNISALALAAAVIPANGIQIMTTTLNVFAIVTAFLGIFLGFREAITGIVVNILARFIPEEKLNNNVVTIGVCGFITIGLWLWVQSHFSILLLAQISSPVYGITTFLVPCYLVYRVPALWKLKSATVYYVAFFGIIICSPPIIKMLGY